MPKLKKGRFGSTVEGMTSYTVEELYDIADSFENQMNDPNNTDDMKWLKSRADSVRKLAIKKEQSREYKKQQ